MRSNFSVPDLIDRWPSLGDFARDANITYGAAKQMRRRGSIPVEYWTTLIGSIFGRSIGLDADQLLKHHSAAETADQSDQEVAA